MNDEKKLKVLWGLAITIIAIAVSVAIAFAVCNLLLTVNYDIKVTNVKYEHPELRITLTAYENLPEITSFRVQLQTIMLKKDVTVQLNKYDNMTLVLDVSGEELLQNVNYSITIFYGRKHQSLFFSIVALGPHKLVATATFLGEKYGR